MLSTHLNSTPNGLLNNAVDQQIELFVDTIDLIGASPIWLVSPIPH
jgi:hypothetical protein